MVAGETRQGAVVDALPVDLFRVLVGLVSAVYFAHLFLQVPDFSGPDGFIDHALAREMFWYTRMGLFHSGMGDGAFRAVYGCGVMASAALVVGYRVRMAAALLFVLAVSAYRWNFLVVYVDDGLMHLALFWLLLLPIGKTLVLSEWARDRAGAVARWSREVVPAGVVQCFLVNLALVDAIAGLWKLSSPMWRDGTALYAVLRMPIAYAPDVWAGEHLPLLRAANYAAIAVELAVPAMLVFRLPSTVKWVLLAGAMALHLGIIATLRIPYANLICLAAMVLAFREEIMAKVCGSATAVARFAPRASWRDRAAVAFVGLLAGAMAAETLVPAWRAPVRARPEASTSRPAVAPGLPIAAPASGDGRVGFMQTAHNPLYAPLWLIGIAQSYRLFDWIDDRNFSVRYRVVEYAADGTRSLVNGRDVFPLSMRGLLLETYLLGVTWGKVPHHRASELKGALLRRYAQRYCRTRVESGEIHVDASVVRLTGRPSDAPSISERLMVFACREREAKVLVPTPDTGPSDLKHLADSVPASGGRVP